MEKIEATNHVDYYRRNSTMQIKLLIKIQAEIAESIAVAYRLIPL